MMPVVDRLEENYGNQIEFRRIDVNSAEGKQTFQAYHLLGHPGYVILNPGNEVLWKGQGEHSYIKLEPRLMAALNSEQP